MTPKTYPVARRFRPRAPNLGPEHIQSYFDSSSLYFQDRRKEDLHHLTVQAWTIPAPVVGLVGLPDQPGRSQGHFRGKD